MCQISHFCSACETHCELKLRLTSRLICRANKHHITIKMKRCLLVLPRSAFAARAIVRGLYRHYFHASRRSQFHTHPHPRTPSLQQASSSAVGVCARSMLRQPLASTPHRLFATGNGLNAAALLTKSLPPIRFVFITPRAIFCNNRWLDVQLTLRRWWFREWETALLRGP